MTLTTWIAGGLFFVAALCGLAIAFIQIRTREYRAPGSTSFEHGLGLLSLRRDLFRPEAHSQILKARRLAVVALILGVLGVVVLNAA